MDDDPCMTPTSDPIPRPDHSRTMPRGRRRIGIHEDGAAFGGLSRYVQVILDALDPEEFDVTMFCHQRTPLRLRPEWRAVVIAGDASPAPADSAGPRVRPAAAAMPGGL